MSTARRSLILVTLASLLLTGCGLVTGDSEPEPPTFEFVYRAHTGGDCMDQILEITNLGLRAHAPVLQLSALDSAGAVLPDVTVTGVFGSDRGELVAPARSGVADVMRFSGENLDRVADVRATVTSAPSVRFPKLVDQPTVTPLDESAAAVSRNDVFDRVRVENSASSPITIRLVYIVWDMPAEGRTQQAQQTEPIGDLVTLPSRGEITVLLTPNEADLVRESSGVAPTSIKAYFSS